MGWLDLSKEEGELLIELRSCIGFESESKLSSYFASEEDVYGDLKYGAICDCLFNLILFANEEKLKDHEFIVLFRTQLKLIENCQNGKTLEENLVFFKTSMFTRVDNEDDPFGLNVGKKMIDYILGSFFQHYELYLHLFHMAQTEEIKREQIEIELVPLVQPFPSPLEESISEDWYNLYINPIGEKDSKFESETVDMITASTDSIKENTISVICNESLADMLMTSFNREKIKQIIADETEKRLGKLKMEMEKKLSEKEALLLKSMNKVTS